MFATETDPRSASTRTVWAVPLAAAALVALLVAFQQTVHEAVQQGELKRRSDALLLEATWRCNTQRERVVREACLQRLEPIPREKARPGTR